MAQRDWRRVIGYIAAALLADQALGWLTSGQVAWETHLGGLLSGLLAGLWLPPYGPEEAGEAG